jgi:hypothetical protein
VPAARCLDFARVPGLVASAALLQDISRVASLVVRLLFACQQTVFGVESVLVSWHRASSRDRLGQVMFAVLAIAIGGVVLAVSAVLVGVVRVIGAGK